MENLDGTIIATALPQMARTFHVGAVRLNAGMTAYMMTLAVFIPVSGWLADRLGSRTVFASAIGIFTLASVLCAEAHTLMFFTLLRICQGLGGAMMVPVGRLIVLRATPKDQMTQAIAYITWPGLVALVLGPPLGGFITTYASWPWIFLLNLPLGIAGLILTMLWVKNVRVAEKHPFDWLTFLPAGVATTGFVYALELFAREGVGWKRPSLLIAVSGACGALAIGAARRRPATSLIDLDSLKIPTYALTVYGASFFRVAIAVLPFLLPLMFQIIFGLTAFQSGSYLLALFAGDLCMKIFVIPLLRRFGFRQLLLVNGVLASFSIALCATFTPTTPTLLILGILFAHGVCRSTSFTCTTTLAYSEIPPAKMSQANGFLSALMQLSAGTGVAVGAVTMRVIAQVSGHRSAMPQLRDFHVAILLMALLSMAPLLRAYRLPHNVGVLVSGHQQTAH